MTGLKISYYELFINIIVYMLSNYQFSGPILRVNMRAFIIFRLPDIVSRKSDMRHYYVVPERRSAKKFLIAAIIYSHLTRFSFSVRTIFSTRELRGTVYTVCIWGRNSMTIVTMRQ